MRDSTPDDLQTPACAAAWRSTQAFVGGALEPSAERSLRAHIKRCAACRDRYQSSVLVVASIGREHRTQRERDVKEVRHKRLLAMATGLRPKDRGRYQRLRTMVYPLLFAILMVAMSGKKSFKKPVRLEVQAGGALAAGKGLEGVAATTQMGRGDWCTTGPGDRVHMDLAGTSITMEGAGRLVIMSVRPPRVHVRGGGYRIEGDCIVNTLKGILDLQDGVMSLWGNGPDIEVEVTAGECTHRSAAGTTKIDGSFRF